MLQLQEGLDLPDCLDLTETEAPSLSCHFSVVILGRVGVPSRCKCAVYDRSSALLNKKK